MISKLRKYEIALREIVHSTFEQAAGAQHVAHMAIVEEILSVDQRLQEALSDLERVRDNLKECELEADPEMRPADGYRRRGLTALGTTIEWIEATIAERAKTRR